MKELNELFCSVHELNLHTPNGVIQDCDTLLKDSIDAADFEINGLFDELFKIWESSSDKAAFKQMFELFTGEELETFLLNCKSVLTEGYNFSERHDSHLHLIPGYSLWLENMEADCTGGNYPKYQIRNASGMVVKTGITCRCGRGCSNTDCIRDDWGYHDTDIEEYRMADSEKH